MLVTVNKEKIQKNKLTERNIAVMYCIDQLIRVGWSLLASAGFNLTVLICTGGKKIFKRTVHETLNRNVLASISETQQYFTTLFFCCFFVLEQ
jgi:hypothetical protein